MKQLVLRLDDDLAARYKSRLALDRTTMQDHLAGFVAAYLDGAVAAACFKPVAKPTVQDAAAAAIRFLNTEPEREVTLEDHLEIFAERGIDLSTIGGEQI